MTAHPVSGLLCSLGLLCGFAPGPIDGVGAPEAGVIAGVVVEEVAKGSPAEKAGLQPGDVILSWSRAASPPANPQPAGGAIESPFALAEVEAEQAPRGPVTLAGRHNQSETTWVFSRVFFGLTVRPPLPEFLLTVYQEGKDLVQAKKVVEGADRWRAATMQATRPGQSVLALWFLSEAGRALAEARMWPEADAAYEDGIREAEGSTRAIVVAQLLREWGETFRKRSEWARAEDCYRRAWTLDGKRDPESLAVAQSLHRLGLVAIDRGDLNGAEQHYLRSFGIREKLASGSLLVAASLNELGILARKRGDLTVAEAYHQSALTIREKLAPESLLVAASLNNLGIIAGERGAQAAAEAFYRRALEINEKLAPDGFAVALNLTNLAFVAGERGDFATTEDYLRRALAIHERLMPEGLVVATVLNNLGRLAQERGDLEAADDHLRRSLAIREKLAPGSLDVAYSLINLGSLAQKLRDLSAAEDDYRRALAIGDNLAPESLAVAEILHDLGDVARDRGDTVVAEEHYRRALAIREKLASGSAFEAESLHALGLIQRRTGRVAAASELFRRALDALEGQRTRLGGTEEARSRFAAKYAAYYHDSIESLIELGRPAEALHVLERSRARSLLALLAERDLLFTADLPPELVRERKLTDAAYDRVQAAIAKLNPAKDDAAIEKLLGRLRELREKQEEIATRIRRASPRLASLQYPRPLDLAGVRDALDPGTLLLAYSVGKEKAVLFAVEPAGGPGSGLSVLLLPVGEKALREKVEAFRIAIQRPARAAREALIAQAAELYDLLIRPAESRVAASQRLLLSADGPLHLLPWAPLVRKEARRPRAAASYLIEWKPLHVVASATVYAELKKSRRSGASSPGRLVAFGDPRYPSFSKDEADRVENAEVRSAVSRGLSLTPLPSTRDEVKGIASLFPDRAEKYLGEEATEERAKSIGQDVRYVHFACHGALDERFPLNSALALTIPEKPAEGQDNGLLQAWEIFDSVRIDADLVTLSACKTALGKEMGGEGLLGLTRAFHYAGARSVLATLWAVSDKSTPRLMKRFYGYLRAGKSRDEALRAAQIDMIRAAGSARNEGGGDLSHPFRWAAFQLSGDWR